MANEEKDAASPQTPQVDLSAFSLESYGPVSIKMPPRQEATETDIDAQLFQYVANAGKGQHIYSLADLNDEWARETFPGVEGVADLRSRIKSELEREFLRGWDNLKVGRCNDALVARVVQPVPEEVVEARLAASRDQYAERLQSFGMTKAQYLASEKLSEEDFERKMRDDVVYQTKLDVAMEKLVEHSGATVAEADLTKYLSCDNPDTYVEELRENGHLEAALKAAARVKVMREVLETAEVIDEA